jgi:hypothetical protein
MEGNTPMIRLSTIVACGGLSLAVAGSAHASFVYASDLAGNLYKVDVDALGGPTTTLLRTNAGAFSIAGGNTPDELFIHNGADMFKYTISTDTMSAPTGVSTGGNAFGEGMNGFWYMGASNFIIRHIPDDNTYVPVPIAGFPDLFAGDFATANDGTSYGAMNASIAIIDKATAGQTPFSGLAGMWGLAFTIDGRMIAGSSTGDVFQVDLNTGVPSLLGNIGFSIADMASERGTVPAPGAMLLLIAGIAGTRRRR